MKPPQRKRNAPEKLDPGPPGSKHDLISARVRKIADRKKKREIKRNQRVKTEDGDLGNDQVDTEETILYMSKLVFLIGGAAGEGFAGGAGGARVPGRSG